jgi:energy-coupling factor transporter ATP-binding protein EcfA2
MLESYQICPYTGLRSFTEEESLYFKGREVDIDQATVQLQKNKFLMLTGASGDGKSSLIYAGIIPNARAGFLKSKYSQWCVADFRPMRSPFHNLCRSVARQLEIADHRMVESELQHGFSAVVDLYKNSKRFVDPDSVAWQQADEKGRAILKREAANLIILVDQFEEFFTNAENYQNGVPSKESNLVLNLLLETARIALDENLPIYVVFTMRSDYIGQCAAFRGLPEYLGFSQFFVPRLNRMQLQQVIEEPAMLSGNRISRRLTERLIHDITEGVDQLPILQHALNQIWVAADRGNEEMDLIHYAMVGGMPVEELPDEHAERFTSWFNTLPPEIKACYHKPNLQNVLDTHTNKIYQQASRYYLEKTGKTISPDDAKQIIKTAFTCLTKIDQGRAVRNRMTLLEITNILGKPQFDTETVGEVLNIFREPGNTFIHPFIIEEDPDSAVLLPIDVLDITHESLIRNWDFLKQWAEEEYDSRNVSLDFEQQLGRWVSSNKSNAFLLSIGPLTYFENWFNKAAPNAHWIARYLPEDAEKEVKLEKANEVLGNAKEFLTRSASKHVITRTIMRIGTRKIAALLGILALITLSAFGVKTYFSRQNNSILKGISKEVYSLANDRKMTSDIKTMMLVEALKTKQATIDEIAAQIKDPLEKVKVVKGIAALLIFQGHDKPAKEITRSVAITDSLLDTFDPATHVGQLSPILNEINNFRAVLKLGYHYRASKEFAELRKKNGARSAKWVDFIAEKQPPSFSDIENFSLALENALDYQSLSQADITKLLGILSPLEPGEKTNWIRSNFDIDKFREVGRLDYGFRHNGLFQELAYLYAASGNSPKALQCIDTLFKYGQINFEGFYENGTDNAWHIASVFYTNKQTGAMDEFVNGYCARTKSTPQDFYARLLGRSLPGYVSNALELFTYMNGRQNLNLASMDQAQLGWFAEKQRAAVRASAINPDDMHFQLANSFKNEGMLRSIQNEFPGRDSATINGLFDQAFQEYRQVSPAFLEVEVKVRGVGGSEELIVPRKYTFIYPDLKYAFHPIEPRAFYHAYLGDQFISYILDRGMFDALYPAAREIAAITKWLYDYNTTQFNFADWQVESPRYAVLQKLETALRHQVNSGAVDINHLYLYLGRMADQAGNRKQALAYYEKLKFEKVINLLRAKEYAGLVRDQSFRLLAEALKVFADNNRMNEVRKMTGMFKNALNRSSLYAYAGSELLTENTSSAVGKQLMDSAKAELTRAENTTESQQNRVNIAYGLTLASPDANAPEATRLIKNLDEKVVALYHITRSFAHHGELYGAMSSIPPSISSTDRGKFLIMTLTGYNEGAKVSGPEWNKNLSYRPPFFYSFIRFIDENS